MGIYGQYILAIAIMRCSILYIGFGLIPALVGSNVEAATKKRRIESNVALYPSP
jgi:hypothetical protein